MALTSEQTERRAAGAAEVRCRCGSLMARLIADRLELKCRRCKRVVVIAGARAQKGWVAIPPHGEVR